VDVLDMLEADVMPFVDVKSIKVSDNTVTVTTDVTDMQVVSKILYNLQMDKRNLSATVTTTAAAKSEVSGEMVTAAIIIQYTGETKEDNTQADNNDAASNQTNSTATDQGGK
jgi:ribosomal protein S7